MKPYRLKQQRLKLLAAQEASMKSGNGQAPDKPPLTPEQLAQQIAQQRMMAAAYAAQQRQAIATALLSGILSGLYSNPELLPEEFGDKAINDALAFTDKLHARLVNDAQAGLKASAPPAANEPPPKLDTELQTATPEPLKAGRPNLDQPVSDKGIGEGAAPDSRTTHGPDAGEAQAPPKPEATN